MPCLWTMASNWLLAHICGDTMIISHKNRFILFSPWKTASSTCNKRLIDYNESVYDGFFYFNKHIRRVVHQHITISEFLSLPESELDYFKASFVRNPYDRAYSGFLQLQRDIVSQPTAHYTDEWIRDLVKTQLVENIERIIESEYDFNKWILSLPEYEIYDVGRNTNMPLYPAYYWTHHRDKQYVDFIGKVESFERDFDRFCDEVGIDYKSEESANITNIHSNKSEDCGQYRYTSRMSRSAIARINDLFSQDFLLFGYERIIK